MAAIDITRQHQLGLEAAKAAVQAVALRLQRDLNASHTWQGNTLNFECPGATGRIVVTEDNLRVTVDTSWLLKPARGRIEQSINEYLDENLA